MEEFIMWNRADLKARAKFSFKNNYWKSVLVSLVFIFVAGGFSVGSGSSSQSIIRSGDEDDSSYYGYYSDEAEEEAVQNLVSTPFGMIAVGMVVTVVLVIIVVAFALRIFLLNPLEVGCDRFFMIDLHEPAQAGSMGFAFDRNYLNVVGVMCERTIYLILWSLLFIIPGIVKSYEYMMVPYLLAENPQLSGEQAFEESRRMMDGQKWNAFVLDVSFLGWMLLSELTVGIVGIFYVNPYVNHTHAALFEALRFGNPMPNPNQKPDLGDLYG
jgi:hypothetical protein